MSSTIASRSGPRTAPPKLEQAVNRNRYADLLRVVAIGAAPAVRELARLRLDACVPDPAAAFLAAHGISGPAGAAVILVGLAGSPAGDLPVQVVDVGRPHATSDEWYLMQMGASHVGC